MPIRILESFDNVDPCRIGSTALIRMTGAENITMCAGADEAALLAESCVSRQHALTHWPPDPWHEHHPALYEGNPSLGIRYWYKIVVTIKSRYRIYIGISYLI